MRKRSDVMRLPASGRHYREGNCRSRRLVVPAAGRQIRKRSDVMRLPASGRRYRVGNCRSRWLVVPAAGRQIRKRSDVMGCRPAAAGTTRVGNCRSRWLVVPAAGRQIRKRSDVMGLPASGRHYPRGELPKPVVGSAGRWPADTETFRRHGVAGQRPALPCGNCRSRWLVVPAAGRQMRKRSDVMGLPASSGRHYRAGNCRSRWLVVPAAGRQIRKRSDVMELPASGRHYRCAEPAHGGGRGA